MGPLEDAPNYERVFALHPDAYGVWQQLVATVKGGMDERRYELVTLAAARRLRSSYCALAHGTILAERFLGDDATRLAATDPASAGLDATEVAAMELADRVVTDATTVTAEQVDALRALGLSDRDILDVILAAAMRCFFSKVLDATGALPDAKFAQLEPRLRDALTVGRPISPR